MGVILEKLKMLKDKAMSDDADFGLVIWKDTSKKSVWEHLSK